MKRIPGKNRSSKHQFTKTPRIPKKTTNPSTGPVGEAAVNVDLKAALVRFLPEKKLLVVRLGHTSQLQKVPNILKLVLLQTPGADSSMEVRLDFAANKLVRVQHVIMLTLVPCHPYEPTKS